ncbi:transporter substrate-binding domain-containing protein [Colwellia sp. Arc7-635]|uniref:substrate-binding periplasmic protein n=1 Tax=Colwellia sp. Arc7-635 TaxID=2497879 RepID=UPI000F8504D8|nr:transporter substrate-binding domain-containing protein [Colwellia sp. Arc7-635]AZQ83579.1 transporter substrate-binding domain-containing protein [Colwellia sp. Arc7-635]
MLKTIFKKCIYFPFLLSINSVLASDIFTEKKLHNSDEYSTEYNIEILAGLPKAPFIIEENGAGLQLDIIREAFASVNHSVNFSHLPLGRSITGFKRFNVDGIATLPEDYQYPGIYISKPYISYQNVAVSLSDKNISIDSIEDLTGKNIIAFQNAKKFIGDDYNASVSLSSDYREIADQSQQIEMLFSRRTEVIILDMNIFAFFVKSNVGGRYNQNFTVHYIFDEREYSAAFKTEQHRDMFDEGIALIKEQGVYQLVLDRYLQ